MRNTQTKRISRIYFRTRGRPAVQLNVFHDGNGAEPDWWRFKSLRGRHICGLSVPTPIGQYSLSIYMWYLWDSYWVVAIWTLLKRLDPNENGQKFEPRRVLKPFLWFSSWPWKTKFQPAFELNTIGRSRYLALMRAEPGPQEWVFQELKAVREMRFRFHQVRRQNASFAIPIYSY